MYLFFGIIKILLSHKFITNTNPSPLVIFIHFTKNIVLVILCFFHSKTFHLYCCIFHLVTLVYTFVGIYLIIILFTSGFKQHVVELDPLSPTNSNVLMDAVLHI